MLDEDNRARRVLMGTCGWSDTSIQRCGRFYPASCRSAEDRLRHYSTFFSCVEVDTSTYAIPTPASIARWLTAVPKGFIFHFKAFGLFPSSQIWQIFNSRLLPVHEAGALGCVVFQFHSGVRACEEERWHVEWCRANLDARYKMAVEFRNREWITGRQLAATCAWLRSLQIALIASDDLRHEMAQPDKAQTGLNPGQGKERVLSDAEMAAWRDRLTSRLPTNLKGPVYFLWGTDHEDQPVVNAKRLTALLGEVAYNWKAFSATCTKTGKLLGFFCELGQVGGAEKETVEGRRGGDSVSGSGLEERGRLRLGIGESVTCDMEAETGIESRETGGAGIQWGADEEFVAGEAVEGGGRCDKVVRGWEEGGSGGAEGWEGGGNERSSGDDEITKAGGYAKEEDAVAVGMRVVVPLSSRTAVPELEHSKERSGKRKDAEFENAEAVGAMIASNVVKRVVAPSRRPTPTSKRRAVQLTSRPITSFFKSMP